MGKIVLSKEEYNNLRGAEIRYWNEDSTPDYFCKEHNGKIYITNDEEGKNVVAQFNANTPDGDLFQRMEGCLLQFIPNEDKKSLSVIRDCQWCDKEIGCRICEKVGYKKLNKIIFVDPVKFRDEDIYLTLDSWKHTIERLAQKPIQTEYDKIIKINDTINQLQNQLIEVLEEWKYEEITQ